MIVRWGFFEMRENETKLASTSVLIADDDSAFRNLMRRRLVRQGYEVIEASDGEGALNVLASGVRPDVVVLDVLMPRCSGLGVLEILRGLGKGKAPPTLMVTGFVDRSIDLVANRLGAFRVFHKPFALDDLVTGRLRGREVVPSRKPGAATLKSVLFLGHDRERERIRAGR